MSQQLCKAALFEDAETFINLYDHSMCETYDGQKCHQIGRKVKNFNQDKWMKYIYEIGLHVTEQKFTKVFGLKRLLCSDDFKGYSIIAKITEVNDEQ